MMSFISTKFHEILLSGFRGVALTRKTGLTDWLTDWLTDGRVKNIIPSATRCVGYNYRAITALTRNLCLKVLIWVTALFSPLLRQARVPRTFSYPDPHDSSFTCSSGWKCTVVHKMFYNICYIYFGSFVVLFLNFTFIYSFFFCRPIKFSECSCNVIKKRRSSRAGSKQHAEPTKSNKATAFCVFKSGATTILFKSKQTQSESWCSESWHSWS